MPIILSTLILSLSAAATIVGNSVSFSSLPPLTQNDVVVLRDMYNYELKAGLTFRNIRGGITIQMLNDAIRSQHPITKSATILGSSVSATQYKILREGLFKKIEK